MKTPEEMAREYSCENYNGLNVVSPYEIETAAEESFIAGFTEATRWRRVEEELPDNEELDFSGFSNTKYIVKFKIGKETFHAIATFYDNHFDVVNVTHWRPIY